MDGMGRTCLGCQAELGPDTRLCPACGRQADNAGPGPVPGGPPPGEFRPGPGGGPGYTVVSPPAPGLPAPQSPGWDVTVTQRPAWPARPLAALPPASPPPAPAPATRPQALPGPTRANPSFGGPPLGGPPLSGPPLGGPQQASPAPTYPPPWYPPPAYQQQQQPGAPGPESFRPYQPPGPASGPPVPPPADPPSGPPRQPPRRHDGRRSGSSPARWVILLVLLVGGGAAAVLIAHPFGRPAIREAASSASRLAVPGHSASAGTGQATPAASPASPSPSAAVSERQAASSVASLLSQSVSDRAAISHAAAQVVDCGPDLNAAPKVFDDAARSRTSLLAGLTALPGRAALPPALVSDLTQAWQASIAADQAYAKWASDEISRGCVANDTNDPGYQATVTPDANATKDKSAFTSQWNAVAGKYGLARYQPGQL